MRRRSQPEMWTPMYDETMSLTRASVSKLDAALLPAEDLTVQIHHDDGCWHRRAIGGTHTACGLPILRHDHHTPRHETYTDNLCRGPKRDGVGACFSTWELAKSDELNAAARASENGHAKDRWSVQSLREEIADTTNDFLKLKKP